MVPLCYQDSGHVAHGQGKAPLLSSQYLDPQGEGSFPQSWTPGSEGQNPSQRSQTKARDSQLQNLQVSGFYLNYLPVHLGKR